LVGTTADFREFGPRPSLPSNHLLCENRRTGGRIGEDGLVYVRTMILRPRLSSPDAGPHRARQLQILRLGEYLHTIRGWLFDRRQAQSRNFLTVAGALRPYVSSIEMAAIGATYPLAVVPAKVSCPNRHRPHASVNSNAGPCPLRDLSSRDRIDRLMR